MDELWKPVTVTGYEKAYEVSNLGRVRNTKTGHILTPMRTGPRRSGAQRSKVRLNTKPRLDYDVGCLVLSAFVESRPAGAVCMHKNDDSSDNRLLNIRWGTPLENARDMARKGRAARQRVTPEMAEAIITMRRGGVPGAVVAAQFGLSQQRVCDIVKGRSVFSR